jgi:MFS family permease
MSEGTKSTAPAVSSPKYAWVILVTVYLLSVAAAMLWFSAPPMAEGIIPTYLPPIDPYFEHTNELFGGLMSSLAIAALLAALVASVLQNKIGVKAILLLAALCILAGSVIAALSSNSYGLLTLSRWVGGFGVGFVAVSATTAVSLWFHDDKRAFALAIWATWVPISMLILFNLVAPYSLSQVEMVEIAGEMHPVFTNLHFIWWFVVVIAAIATVLTLVFYRLPAKENAQISTESVTLKAGLKVLMNRQTIALMVCMFLYTCVSHCFTTFNVTFFTSPKDGTMLAGLGLETGVANLIASITSAAGILAPIFGKVSDMINANRKFLLIVLGACFYLCACLLGFKDLGMFAFVLWIITMMLANSMLVATIRPMMPLLIGRIGGFTAVTLGMAFITFLEFAGQIFTSYYGAVVDALGWTLASLAVASPVAALLVICALLIKPAKQPQKVAEAT